MYCKEEYQMIITITELLNISFVQKNAQYCIEEQIFLIDEHVLQQTTIELTLIAGRLIIIKIIIFGVGYGKSYDIISISYNNFLIRKFYHRYCVCIYYFMHHFFFFFFLLDT